MISEQQTESTLRPVRSGGGKKVKQTFHQNPGQRSPLCQLLCQCSSMIRSLFEPRRSPHTNTSLLIGMSQGWERVGRRWGRAVKSDLHHRRGEISSSPCFYSGYQVQSGSHLVTSSSMWYFPAVCPGRISKSSRGAADGWLAGINKGALCVWLHRF